MFPSQKRRPWDSSAFAPQHGEAQTSQGLVFLHDLKPTCKPLFSGIGEMSGVDPYQHTPPVSGVCAPWGALLPALLAGRDLEIDGSELLKRTPHLLALLFFLGGRKDSLLTAFLQITYAAAGGVFRISFLFFFNFIKKFFLACIHF